MLGKERWAMLNGLRRMVDVQTGRYARWLMRDIPNPTHDWHGETEDCGRAIQMLRLGDCSWHVIEHGHAFGEPGYPAVLGERLRDAGIALRFKDCFVGRARDLHPPTLSRVCKARPDVIIVQMGAGHGHLELVPLYRINLIVARLRVNRRLGRFGGWLHRSLTARLLRRFGRPMIPGCDPEEAREGFARLSSWIAENCPGTPWAYLPPNPPVRRGWADPEIITRVTEIYARAVVVNGGAFLDPRGPLAELVAELGPEAVYGATGYDLRRVGHEVVERTVSQWMSRVGVLDAERGLALVDRSAAGTSTERGSAVGQLARTA